MDKLQQMLSEALDKPLNEATNPAKLGCLVKCKEYNDDNVIIIGGPWKLKDKAKRNNIKQAIKLLGGTIEFEAEELDDFEELYTDNDVFVYAAKPNTNKFSCFIYEELYGLELK